MNKFIVGILLVLAFSQICLSGHIYTWDVDLFYQNEKNAQRISIFFSLESGLAKDQFIRVRFPDSGTIVSSGSLSPVGQTATSGSISVTTSTSDVFVSVNSDIPSNTWYQLNLNFGTTYISGQTPGYKGVIQIETASAGSDTANRIIYDSNSVAAVYQLAPRPTETLTLAANYLSTVTATQRQTLANQYDVFFDLKPQVSVKGGTKLRIELENANWKFGSSCSGADQQCGEGTANCENITLVQGACTVATGNQVLELVATSDIVKDQTARIKTTIINPTLIRTSIGATAYSISKVANLIFEKKTVSSLFSVVGITPGTPTIKYLWGVSSFASGKTLCPLGFYKKATNAQTSADAAKVDIYNDLTLEFTIPTTPSGQNLEISIAIPSDITVISGSVRTDLPTFSGTTQVLTVIPAASGNPGAIKFRNIAPLSGSNTYKVLAKVYLASGATAGESLSGFTLTLRAVDGEGQVDLGSSSTASYKIYNNYEYLDWGSAAVTNGIHRASSAAAYKSGFGSVFSKTGTTLSLQSGSTVNYVSNIADFIKNLYYGNGADSVTSYPGVYIGTTVTELIFLISPTLDQLCCTTGANCETNSDNTLCSGDDLADAASKKRYHPAISLYIVANSNLLNLDNTEGTRNGIFTYDKFWGGCSILTSAISTGSEVCFSNGRSVATSPSTTEAATILKNRWELDSGIGYLQATCIPKTFSTAPDCLKRSTNTVGGTGLANANTVSNAIGIRAKSESIFKSTDIPQLYGGQGVIDFIVCLGYSNIAAVSDTPTPTAGQGRPTTDPTYTRASQSLLNVYALNTGTTADTLRVRLFNYLRTTSDYHKAPVFLRLSNYIGGSTSFTSLNVFLDQRLGLGFAKQCTSTASAYSCNPFTSAIGESGNPLVRSRIDINSAIGSGSTATIEFFIPIVPNTNDITDTLFIDVGLSNIEENYVKLKEIYRIYGFLWGLHSNAVNRVYLTFSEGPTGGSPTARTFLYAADTNIITGAGCTDSGTQILTPAEFYPGNFYDTTASITSGLTSTDCLGTEGGDVLKGGTGFTVTHFSQEHDLLGSGSAKWKDSIACPKFVINYGAGKLTNGFVCGLVGTSGSGSGTSIAASNTVNLKSFTVPWTWGASYASPATSFSWSGDAKGHIKAFKLQPTLPSAAYQRTCTLGDWGTVYKSSSLQRLSFTFSPSQGIDLTKSSFIFVASFLKNRVGFSTSDCWITLSSGLGTCTVTSSTSTTTLTVTRTAPSSGSLGSLAKGTQTVTLAVSQSDSSWQDTSASIDYNAIIRLDDTNKIDSCESNKKISYSTSDDTPVLSLGVPMLQLSKSSRTSFSFTFSVGTTSRQIWTNTKFDFILGWLGDQLAGVSANLHCFIRTGNSVSFSFKTLDLTSPAAPSLAPVSNLPVGSWTYVCNGARAPALTSSTKLTFAWKGSSETLANIAEDNTNAIASSSVTLTDAQAVLEASLKSKLWATPGFEASYTFLVKPKRANYTLEARIYVDFPIDYPPRGNEAGVPSCEINSTRVFCEWAQERRLVVWPVIPLTALSTQTSYELNVHGISQPTVLGAFKNIAITLDTDSNPNNGVSEWNDAILDTSPSTTAISPLLISEYANSVSNTRSTTEIKINFYLPKDTVVKDARVYVELPPYFGDSLWLVSSVTCNLYRISDLTSSNLVQNCTLLRNRRVKIFTNLDSGSNVDNIYVLSIGGIPTPAQPTVNAPNWVTVFLASQDEVTISHRTAPGYINATHVVYNHEVNKQVPDWFVRTAQGVSRVNGDLEVTIGIYRTDVVLRSPTVSEVSYNYALGGEYISNLAIFPSNLRVVFGEPESRFRIGAKANAIQGRYLVTSSKSNEQNAAKQVPIPTLPILVRNNTCVVNANNENIKVPAGGWSLPIIFDFMDCMPVTDVQVDANFTDVDKYNISFGPEVSNTLASEKLVFESWNNTRVSFIVRSFNASQKAGLKTKISFSLSGTNKDSFGAPKPVNVELVDSAPYNVAPTVTTFSASAVAGQVTLNLACSATGNIYFAVGTNPDIQSISVGTIKNATYARKLTLTPRDPTDPWWRVHGFVSQPGTTAVSIVIPGVKSSALYYGVAYCQNQMEIPSSNNLKTSWNQTDNGGRVAKATLVFNASLTLDQQKDIACALASLLKVPQNTVMTQDGVFCSTLRRLQSSNSSNSSNTTTNSTPVVQQNVSYSWFVLPDYAAPQSAIHTNLQTQMVAGFTDKLFALTTGRANTFPMVRSFSFFAPSSAVAAPPSTNEINPTINIFETYVTFDIILSNSSGYVYWGIGANSSSKPVGRILRDKVDANGVALIAADRKYVPAKTTVSFNATSSLVRNDTDYRLFIALSSDDPGPEASFSDVVEKSFRTKKPSFSSRTVLGSLFGLLLLIVAMFVF